jgi:hypothetical protein
MIRSISHRLEAALSATAATLLLAPLVVASAIFLTTAA